MGALVRGGTRQENMCGRRSFHLQKSQSSDCAFHAARARREYQRGFLQLGNPRASVCWKYHWIRRNMTAPDRMRYLSFVPRRFKSHFRKGTQAAPRKTATVAST